MAAGDIIIPDNTITPELLDKIAAEVQNRILSTSKDPGQYEEVDSLTGITSIPVFQQSGSTYKLVRVLLSILKGVDGKEVHLQSTDTHLQWRWTDGMWENLVAWADLKGDPGDTPVFRTSSFGIEWKYESEDETEWKELVTFEVLKLKFSDLTEENIAEFWRGVPDDIMAEFQKPATDAAAEVREQMVQISQKVNETIADTEEARDRADLSANEADQARISLAESVQRKLTEVDNKLLTVQDGKTTQFEIGTVKSGTVPSASLTDNGTDTDGNPKKALNLVMEKGEKGDKGNTMFATFDIDPVTGELAMYTDEEYAGPTFELNNNGELSVII